MRPDTLADLTDAVAQAAAAGTRLEIRGGGSKRDVGAPRDGVTLLDMRSFAGVIDYDPAELVLTVGAATPLLEIEELISNKGQMLAFEPFDHGPMFGSEAKNSTIGGIIAAAVAGSRRLTRGGVRDHLLGFTAVSGRGESFVAGARVVKNVTGYDLPKLAAGSWGRLFAMTEVTLKVLPAPRATVTRLIRGLSPTEAYHAMSRALGSQAEVTAAAHFPQSPDGGPATILRLEGFAPSVAARSAMLDALLSAETLPPETADTFWRNLQTLESLAGDQPLWRLSIPAKAFPDVADAIAGAQWLADWAGGLIWATFDGDPAVIRDVAKRADGHATLVRADPEMRSRVSALQPQPPGVAALEERIRRAFDPAGVFETGRFMEQARAD